MEGRTCQIQAKSIGLAIIGVQQVWVKTIFPEVLNLPMLILYLSLQIHVISEILTSITMICI